MEIIRGAAHARVGLLGNPSDGYHGKAISLIWKRFAARVVLYEWEDMEIVLAEEDRSRFGSVHDLVRDVHQHGYYGGIRLVKATVKRFVEYCQGRHPLHERNFSIRYETNIPRAVGLAGSSAIIVATLRALMQFYDVTIPQRVLPSLALSVETEELGIAAGLQDRVIQVYEGMVFMDFSRERTETIDDLECGCYEPLDPTGLPPLYVAYSTAAGEPTEVVHSDLRARYEQGDPEVLRSIKLFAGLAQQFRDQWTAGNGERLPQLVDENFDLRSGICRMQRQHREMVEVARKAGATAKFAGSGGAIVGTCPDETVWEQLEEQLGRLGCSVNRLDFG